MENDNDNDDEWVDRQCGGGLMGGGEKGDAEAAQKK